ncbi:MAG: YeeE/YedE family protein [Steroidobacteraceae bacterium]
MAHWMNGLVGGALIGLSATLLLWSIGRIAGISGIVNSLGTAPRSDRAWRAAFLIGLMVAGGIAMQFLSYAPSRLQTGSTPILLLAGLLVGFGTRMGNGCTSGHGVCGLGRLSWRSLAAVVTFMATAIVTVFVMRHLVGAEP